MSDGVRYTYATEKGRQCWRKVVETSIPNVTQNRCLQCQKSTLEAGQDAVIKRECSLKRQCDLGVQNTRSSLSFSSFFLFFFTLMGRAPCCSKVGLHKGPWTTKEDALLTKYIQAHGEGQWRSLPKKAGNLFQQVLHSFMHLYLQIITQKLLMVMCPQLHFTI